MRGSSAEWAMLTILLLSALLPSINMAYATNLSLASGTTLGTFKEGESSNSTAFPSTPPTIQDFLINNTATGDTTQFAFIVSDSVALQNCTFSNDNGTGTWSNSSLELSGTGPVYANFTINPFTATTLLNFTFWLWNTNSSILPTTIGYRTLAIYNSSMPYTSLGQAIAAVQNANNWETANDALSITGVDAYQGLILNQNTTAQYESLIDSYANGQTVTVPTTKIYCYGYFTDVGWGNPSNAYDNNTGTSASATVPPSGSTSIIGFSLSVPVTGTIIQYWVSDTNTSCVSAMNVYIGNNTSSFISVFSGTPTWDAYANLTFALSTFSYMEFSFTDNSGGSTIVSLWETQAFSGGYDYKICDYLDVLKYCSYAQKMNLTWSNQQEDLVEALGNITMVGSLPATDYGALAYGFRATDGDFMVQNTWALYGYYYANLYNVDPSQWNISAAYNQFDSAVNFSVTDQTNPNFAYREGMPLWIWGTSSDGQGSTYLNRYYDEDAECIEDYLTFYSLLNVTDALNKAVYWWGYLVDTHWNPLDSESADTNLTYFRYSNYYDASYAYSMECEAGFFLKDISTLKCYEPNLVNYSYVLEDIGLRFLSSEWESGQWTTSPEAPSSYVVVHADVGNAELRLENTLGARQALLGCYLQITASDQTNMRDMLSGNTTTGVEPAWSLLLSSTANIWNSSSDLFRQSSIATTTSPYATAEGEITLFQIGIIPGTTTVAFPLEELAYQYVSDIDPVIMSFNLNQTAHQITVPVVQAGTITFDYGQSPITCNFTSGGVYVINFTSSWNMISSVTYKSALPSNLVYFYLPVSPLAVNISPTSATLSVGQSELFISNVSGGTSPYAYQWYLNGSAVQNATYNSWTFTPTSSGPYTVYIEVNDSVGAQATSNTVTGTVNVDTHDVAVTDLTSYQTITGQGFCNNITVTIANIGSYSETFNVTVYANAAIIVTIANITLASGNSVNQNILWNTTGFAYGNYTLSAYSWPVPGENDTASTFVGGVVTVTILGDVDGNGRVNMADIVSLCAAFSSTLGQPNWNSNCDIEGNGRVDMGDIVIACANFGQHNP